MDKAGVIKDKEDKLIHKHSKKDEYQLVAGLEEPGLAAGSVEDGFTDSLAIEDEFIENPNPLALSSEPPLRGRLGTFSKEERHQHVFSSIRDQFLHYMNHNWTPDMPWKWNGETILELAAVRFLKFLFLTGVLLVFDHYLVKWLVRLL